MEDDDYTRITLRIPKKLHNMLMRQAYVTSKSNNAEIIGRLQSTFDAPASPQLTPDVRSAVEREIERHGGTAEEALLRLVQAGEQQSHVVLNIRTHHGITLEEFTSMLIVATENLPSGTVIVPKQD